jgi:serine/threonine protein kinase/tetratricopeptide (TPR) repeat protein
MDQDRWQKVNRIFHDALALDPRERQKFVRVESKKDLSIEDEVLLLLQADSLAGSYLELPLLSPGQLGDSDSSLSPGDVLCERFRIVRAIGEGGMGQVFEALDSELSVRVALKVIRPEIATSAEALDRFRQEVSLARRITHPNVCRTFDIARDSRTTSKSSGLNRDFLFLSMEFLEGETLASRLRREGALSLELAYTLARQIAGGIQAASELGIVHRDLKPANVMLVPNGDLVRAVITDFGLARLLQSEARLQNQSSSSLSLGKPVGTLAYMAPEQLKGLAVSASTDIYAFGLILFEMVTGTRAFPSDDPLVGIAQRVEGRFPDPDSIVPNLPQNLRRAIDGCLIADPSKRFNSANLVMRALEGDQTVRINTANKSVKRRSLNVTILSVVCVALLIVAFRIWRLSGDPSVRPGALVYLAPIENRTRDRNLDGLAELLRASLGQSPQITLLEQARVGDVMQQMAKPAGVRIDEETAREIALRTGAARVVFPVAQSSNGAFKLDIEIQEPDTSTPSRFRAHWSRRFEASSPGSTTTGTIPAELIAVVRDAGDWIRREVGESKNDIARLDAAPEDVTTGKWAALVEYERALQLQLSGQTSSAVAALKNATVIDPNFALAFGRLGDLEVSLGNLDDGYEAYRQALEASEKLRLTRREQDRIRGLLALDTGDYLSAETAFRDYTVYYPADYLGWFYRGYPLMMLGRVDESLGSLRHAYELDPQQASPPAELGLFDAALNNQVEAQSLADHLSHSGGSFQAEIIEGAAAFVGRRFDKAKESFDSIANTESFPPENRSLGFSLLARVLAETGQIDSARDVLERGIADDKAHGNQAGEANKMLDIAYLACRGSSTLECISYIQGALSIKPDSHAIVLADLSLETALFRGQDEPRIRLELSKIDKLAQQKDFGETSKVAQHLSHAVLLLSEHEWQKAIDSLRKTAIHDAPGRCRAYLPMGLDYVSLRSGRAAFVDRTRREAIDKYREIADHPNLVWSTPAYFPPGFLADQMESYLSIESPPAEFRDDFNVVAESYRRLRRRASSHPARTNP